MSKQILVLGDSGSGKSTSIESLNHKETFLVNVIGKDLPFRGSKAKYIEIANKKGNKFTSDNYTSISKLIDFINNERPEIKNIVLDDAQYLMINEFMKKHAEHRVGTAVFELYNEIADHFWNLIKLTQKLRNDLYVFFLQHTDYDADQNKVKPKTIGKLLDDKVNICGMFTYVIHAKYNMTKEQFVFETKTDGIVPAKTPVGMFTNRLMPNNLQMIKDAIISYDEEDINKNMNTNHSTSKPKNKTVSKSK